MHELSIETMDEEWVWCTHDFIGIKAQTNMARPTQQSQPEKPTLVIEELSDSSSDSNGFKTGGMGCGRAVPFISLLDEAASPVHQTDLSLTIGKLHCIILHQLNSCDYICQDLLLDIKV